MTYEEQLDDTIAKLKAELSKIKEAKRKIDSKSFFKKVNNVDEDAAHTKWMPLVAYIKDSRVRRVIAKRLEMASIMFDNVSDTIPSPSIKSIVFPALARYVDDI